MCSIFECLKTPAEDSIEIKHGTVTVGHICKDCLDGVAGVRILLKKHSAGYLLEQVDLMEKVL
jgi:hypothetical protein